MNQAAQHTPAGMGRAITAQRVARYELFDDLQTVSSHYTAQDREVRAELEASEMLREFMATEL